MKHKINLKMKELENIIPCFECSNIDTKLHNKKIILDGEIYKTV